MILRESLMLLALCRRLSKLFKQGNGLEKDRKDQD